MTGLDAWEQAWEEWLLLDETAAESVPLTLSEGGYLPVLVPSERQVWLQTARLGRTTQLLSHLPPRLGLLLGADYASELLARLPLSLMSQAGFSDFKLALLVGLQSVLAAEEVVIPHLAQVLEYEITVLKLHYHRLPHPLLWGEAPAWADWACLLKAGPHLSEVLERLRLGKALSPCSEFPLQTYLLTRDLGGARIEALHPLVAACLAEVDGQRFWSQIVESVLAEYTGPSLELSALIDWLPYLVRRGILRLSSAAELDLFLGQT